MVVILVDPLIGQFPPLVRFAVGRVPRVLVVNIMVLLAMFKQGAGNGFLRPAEHAPPAKQRFHVWRI
jgi:hypothetical protein